MASERTEQRFKQSSHGLFELDICSMGFCLLHLDDPLCSMI